MNGTDVHRGIESSIADAERDRAGLDGRIAGAERDLDKRLAERDQCFDRLAELYLPELGAEVIEPLRARLPEIHRRASAILAEKEAERRELEEQMAAHRDARVRFQQELEAVTSQLEAKVKEREVLRDRMQEALEAKPDYTALVEQTRLAAEQLEQQRRRFDAANAEVHEKVPAYEENLLFGYLLARRYAAAGYRANPLTRVLDGWVARLVDYVEQRKSYEHLKAVRSAMHRQAEQREKELTERLERLGSMEREEADRLGLTVVMEQGTALYRKRADLVTGIEQAEQDDERRTTRWTELESRRGEYYHRALAESVAFLRGQETESLRAVARSTDTRSDDGLVDRIDTLGDQIERLRGDADELRRRRDELADRLRGLRRIERRYRRQDYDSSNSRFSRGFDIGDLLVGYMLGRYNADHVNARIDRGQKFIRRTHTFGSGRSSSSSSSSSFSFGGGSSGGFSSGGFSSGGFSSGGGFGGGGGGGGGGGFSTGGGF